MNCNSQGFEHESSVYWHGQSENMLSVYIRSLKVGSGWIYRVYNTVTPTVEKHLYKRILFFLKNTISYVNLRGDELNY